MNNQLWLPGLEFRFVDVFKVKRGQRVYDKDSKRYGVVERVGEGAFECVEAFIRFDGEKNLIKAYQVKNLVIA